MSRHIENFKKKYIYIRDFFYSLSIKEYLGVERPWSLSYLSGLGDKMIHTCVLLDSCTVLLYFWVVEPNYKQQEVLKSRFLVSPNPYPHMAGVSWNKVGTMPLWPHLPLASSQSTHSFMWPPAPKHWVCVSWFDTIIHLIPKDLIPVCQAKGSCNLNQLPHMGNSLSGKAAHFISEQLWLLRKLSLSSPSPSEFPNRLGWLALNLLVSWRIRS